MPRKSGTPSIVYPKVDPRVWAKRYGLMPKAHPCPVCKKPTIPSVPFATGSWRGLAAAEHGCKANGSPSTATLVGKEGEEFKKVVSGIFDALT